MATTSALQLQTYESIVTYNASVTNPTSYTFSSIPQKYTNLILVVNSSTTSLPAFQFNGDTGSNYALPYSSWGLTTFMTTSLYGTITGQANTYIRYGNPAYGNTAHWEFPNYSKSGIKKAVYGHFTSGAGATVTAGSWEGTDAITSINVSFTFTGTVDIALYGIKAA